MQCFHVSISLGFVVSTTLLVVLGSYWKRRRYSKSAPIIKRFAYDRRQVNINIPSGICVGQNNSQKQIIVKIILSVTVSSFRIFRTSHRSLSPSVKSTNRQASVISSVQDAQTPCRSVEIKYTAPQQLGVMGKKCPLHFFFLQFSLII